MTTQELLKQLRTESGWYAGDLRATEVLNKFREAILAPIASAASFDPAQDRDLETCVRRLYHEAQANAAYKLDHDKAINACMWMHDDKTLNIPLGARLTSDGVTALRKQRDELREHIAAMTQARDDAVQAAHLIAEELDRCKRRAGA
jgi:hypothetical protein